MTTKECNKKYLEIRDKVFNGDRGAEIKYHRQILESNFMMNLALAEAMAELQPELYQKYLDKINGYDPYLKANMINSIDKLKQIKQCLCYPQRTIDDIDTFKNRLFESHPDWVAPQEGE